MLLRKYRDLYSEKIKVNYSRLTFSSIRYVSLQLGILLSQGPMKIGYTRAGTLC